MHYLIWIQVNNERRTHTAHTHIQHTRTHTHIHAHTQRRARAHTQTNKNTHTHTHTHIHTSPRSGALQPGDWILGINGVPTQNFMQTEVNTLLQNAGNVINLEIAFEAPPGKLAIAVIETFVPSLL